jgi:hypothetical protein
MPNIYVLKYFFIVYFQVAYSSQTSKIMKFQYNSCKIHLTICPCKIHGIWNVKMIAKNKNSIQMIWFFKLMMF